MIELSCEKIDDTDYYYFFPASQPEHLLFTIHCDEMDYFVGEDAYKAIIRAENNGAKVTLTIAVSVHSS